MPTGTMQGRRRELSAAERAARRDAGREKARAAVERLETGVRALIEDDAAFREYLRCSGRMHGYSWRNRLLIALQRPDASMVAGFHRWRELGRPVVKGSKGIQILSPMVKVSDVGVEHAGESTFNGSVDADGKLRSVVGFRVAYVFAVEDTDGPAMARPHPIAPDDDSVEARELADRLLRSAGELGFPVDVRHDDPALGSGDGLPAGWANLATGTIVVNGGLAAAHRAKTIAHETAHLLAEHRANHDDRRDAEAVAEGAAFVVASYFGLATDTYSLPYIAAWAEDVARVKRLLDRIVDVGGRIIQAAEGIGGCSSCGWDGVAEHGGCEHCR